MVTNTGKPMFGSVADPKCPANSANYGRKADSSIPSGKEPKGARQSSGEVTHDRGGGLNDAGKGENLNDMPTVHTGGGKGNISGVA